MSSGEGRGLLSRTVAGNQAYKKDYKQISRVHGSSVLTVTQLTVSNYFYKHYKILPVNKVTQIELSLPNFQLFTGGPAFSIFSSF